MMYKAKKTYHWNTEMAWPSTISFPSSWCTSPL